jgi:hypothetical protein
MGYAENDDGGWADDIAAAYVELQAWLYMLYICSTVYDVYIECHLAISS